MSCLAKVSKKVCFIGLITILTSAISSVGHAAGILKDSYPERYTVTKGDTLWDISGKYLNEPWRWPELWKANEYIKNPDLIFPGDVLVLTFIDGQPVLRALKRETVTLKPTIRVQDINNAIPPISPKAIKPYLLAPLVTTEEEVDSAAYIVDGFNNRLIGGKSEQMYARGIKETSKTDFQIFRPGRVLVHPVTKEDLGLEAVDVGIAELAKPGDPARVLIKSSKEDVVILDRLRPINDTGALPFFFPSTNSDVDIKGFILEPERKTPEIGRLDSIVTVALGEREGVEPGQVFKVLSQPVTKLDPLKTERGFKLFRKKDENFTIPSEDIGLIMIIRVFEKVSYAIVTNTERPLSPGDLIVHPKFNSLD